MKLKQSPDDFVVEELTAVTPGPSGEFAFYRLDKTGWTTPDAVAAVRRRWDLDARRVGYGGLKDRHARTSQYLTVFRGPRRNLSHERIALTYLGQVLEPYSSRDIRANRFAVSLRALRSDELEPMHAAVREVNVAGLPNYFDDQRFGSAGSGEFVALEMVRGNFEAALRLALAAPYEFDRAEQKQEKALLTQHWGDWPRLKAELPRGHARSLVDYLVTHPTDFKGAVARLRPDLQGLYLSAYQSHVWNRLLARWLVEKVPAEKLGMIELQLGSVPVPRAEWDAPELPLPSARLKPDPASPWLPMLTEVLAEDGLTLEKMRIPGLQKPFFSKGERPACVRPDGLSVEVADDDRHPGRTKVTLRFELPRGSYATMLVKRITAVKV